VKAKAIVRERLIVPFSPALCAATASDAPA